MSKQQKKFQKKKARERAVKTKLLNKREFLRNKKKELREEAQSIESVNKIIKQRIELEQWAKQVEGKIPEDVHSQIQNNISILKALEEEYAQEMKAKLDVQQSLENQGHHTLPEMLGALHTPPQEKTLDVSPVSDNIVTSSSASDHAVVNID